MVPDKLISTLGLDLGGTQAAFTGDAAGALANAQGERVTSLPASLLGALRFVLEKQRAGSWRTTLRTIGRSCGKQIGTGLDAQLAALKLPGLTALPLENSLDFLTRHFALNAWGVLALDLSAAESRGIVVAQLERSAFAAALTDANEYADAFVTGVLEGYVEHASGQMLAGAELACARRGAPRCTFVLATVERLTPILPLIGRETADALIARMKG
jgi:predicted hydrocarbon binding protein